MVNPDMFMRERDDFCIFVDGSTTHYYKSLLTIHSKMKPVPNVLITNLVKYDDGVVICGSKKAMASFLNQLGDESERRKKTNKLIGYTQSLIVEKLKNF